LQQDASLAAPSFWALGYSLPGAVAHDKVSVRIILLIGTAILWAFFAYVVIDASIIHSHKEPILDYFLVYGIFIYLGVNFIYLVRRQRK
jgi:hypothetical protein